MVCASSCGWSWYAVCVDVSLLTYHNYLTASKTERYGSYTKRVP